MTILTVTLNWEGNPWWLLPLIPVGIIFVIWAYKRTVPGISNLLRIVLILIRASAISFLILLLFKPVIKIESDESRLPDLGILIDESASIDIIDRLGSRPEIIKELLNRERMSLLKVKFNPRFFFFSDTLVEHDRFNSDSLVFRGISTNISQALALATGMLSSQHGALLLISDGAFNSGSEPSRIAAHSPLPIFTVAVGDSSPPLDLSIADIKFNPILYLGDEVDVELTILGAAGSSTMLEMTDGGGSTIERLPIAFSSNTCETRVNLVFKPQETGIQTYEISLAEIEGEISTKNNLRHLTLNVLESRVKILLISGSPSPDFAFIKRMLGRNENITLNALVQKKGGRFYSNPEIDSISRYDLFIFLDYPTIESDRKFLGELLAAVESGVPLALIPGNSFSPPTLRSIEYILPMEFHRRGNEVETKLLPELSVSPLTEFFPLQYDWSDLPPVRTFQGWMKVKPEAVQLARLDNGEAAAVIFKSGANKSLVYNFHDIWRLCLQDPEHSHGDSLMTEFWRRAARWLCIKLQEELFQVELPKDVYTSGERIPFTAWVYNESYKPLKGALVTAEVSGAEGALSLDLKPVGEGQYSAEARFFQEGNYRFRAKAVSGNDTLKTEGQFIVESFNPELIDPAMRPAVLRSIAQASGGKFYFPQDFASFFDDYNPPPVAYTKSSEIRIFPRWLSLILIILLLSVEWFVRKRKGML